VKRFRCIVADPPWNERGAGKVKRGADRHYKTLKKHEIIEVMLRADVWRPHKDSHLWLWITNNYLKDGLFVMEALGFRHITQATWAKDRFGLGQYMRGQTEHCLFGVRYGGRLPSKVKDKSTLFAGGIIPRTDKHSKKPVGAYKQIEAISPGPRLEMFAREPRKGYTVWGNEV
jgi:N6-adenosine-specific RNA methylase IME4